MCIPAPWHRIAKMGRTLALRRVSHVAQSRLAPRGTRPVARLPAKSLLLAASAGC